MSESTTVAKDLAKVEPLLVCEKTAAKLLALSPSTLIAARFRGKPLLPFVRAGKRNIRYRIADIHAYIQNNLQPARG